MAKRIQIITYNCPRCSKTVAGLSKAIHGSESMRRKYAGVCSSCITKEEREEREEILQNQAQGLLSKVGSNG